MDEKTLALLEDYFGYHGFSILLLIPFLVGIVSLFISGRRVRGLLLMISSILFSCGYFGLVYDYISVAEMVLLAAVVVPLRIISWVKFHDFSAKKCIITLIVYPLVVVGLLVAIPLIEKQEALLFIKALTSTEWLYILFFACLGIWVIPYVLKILDFMSECTNINSYSNYDGVNGATGNEDVTK